MPLYEFFCDCGRRQELLVKTELRPRRVSCECGGDAEYHPSAPAHFRIAIEGGGRPGYKMDMGNGRRTVRSKTRERWEHQAGNLPAKAYHEAPRERSKSVYTREYQRKVDADNQAKVERRARIARNMINGGK